MASLVKSSCGRNDGCGVASKHRTEFGKEGMLPDTEWEFFILIVRRYKRHRRKSPKSRIRVLSLIFNHTALYHAALLKKPLAAYWVVPVFCCQVLCCCTLSGELLMAVVPDNVCFLGRGSVQFRSAACLPKLYRAVCGRREVFIGLSSRTHFC